MSSYYARLSSLSLLQLAWKRISKTNKFSRGFDEISIETFSKNSDAYLRKIQQELINRTFEFTPARGVFIPKEEGGKRPIKVPAVRDRVVLKAVEILIAPKFRKYNLPCSYGYVQGRSVPDAINAIRRYARSGLVWVLEGDISRFFDTVDQKLLIDRFIKEIRIKTLIDIVARALKVELGNAQFFTPVDRELFPAPDSGIPQGGILSPLLANFYLYPFDKIMSKHGFKLVRYADDFVVMCSSKQSAYSAYQLCRNELERKLRLKIHHLETTGSKTKITLFSKGFTFLGIRFEGHKVFPSSKSVKRFRVKVKNISDKGHGYNLLITLTKLKHLILGWGNSYKSYETRPLFRELDTFVRQCMSSYLRANGFMGRQRTVGKHQAKILGLPSLERLHSHKSV